MNQALMDQANWLEDVLAGLLINGVATADIEVRRFQDDPLRVAVAVRGVQKYEHRIVIPNPPVADSPKSL